MVVGAGLPSLPALAGEAKSYAERLFAFRVIDSLDQTAASAALATPADEEGVQWQPAALAAVVDATDATDSPASRRSHTSDLSDSDKRFTTHLLDETPQLSPSDATIP